MADFQVFGLRSTGDDVIVNVEHIARGQAVYVADDHDFQATLHRDDGDAIDTCDFYDSVVARLGRTRAKVAS